MNLVLPPLLNNRWRWQLAVTRSMHTQPSDHQHCSNYELLCFVIVVLCYVQNNI